jgi:hypothetical protein
VFERSILLSLMAASLAALAAPAALANPAPLDHQEEEEGDREKGGGNAIDRAAPGATAERRGKPDDYEIDLYFWAAFLGLDDPSDLEDSEFATLDEEIDQVLRDSGKLWRGESFVDVGGTPAPSGPGPTEASELELLTDAPAESVLDQIDERQAPLPMVGEPGSTSAATIPAPAPSEATPPAESILDYLDSAPQPQPTQDAAKPAVNQAAPPTIQAKE